jgi:hypothetical protein
MRQRPQAARRLGAHLESATSLLGLKIVIAENGDVVTVLPACRAVSNSGGDTAHLRVQIRRAPGAPQPAGPGLRRSVAPFDAATQDLRVRVEPGRVPAATLRTGDSEVTSPHNGGLTRTCGAVRFGGLDQRHPRALDKPPAAVQGRTPHSRAWVH